jgi:hypothetical protein
VSRSPESRAAPPAISGLGVRVQLALAGVALVVLWAVATTIGPFSDTTVNDLYVYRTYADLLVAGQLPYLDFGFEYPPLAAVPLWLAGVPGTGEAGYAVSFAVLMGACAVAGQQLTARLAGAAVGAAGAAREALAPGGSRTALAAAREGRAGGGRGTALAADRDAPAGGGRGTALAADREGPAGGGRGTALDADPEGPAGDGRGTARDADPEGPAGDGRGSARDAARDAPAEGGRGTALAAARAPQAGREAVIVAWLLALAPIVIGAAVRTHFDALPIAITMAALLAFARERPALGFALLGAGTMTKLFPGLLAVVAFVWLFRARGERAAALRGAAIFTAVVLAISLPFAGSGYVDSFTFHLDRPVQIESTPATVLFALGGSDVTGTNLRPDRFKSNGLDGGFAPEVQRLFALLLAGALALIVALAARARDARHLVLCGFAVLLAFVTLGKVFSPQYVIWLAPFAALAWVWGRRAVALLVGAAIILTRVEFPSRYFDLINQRHGVILVVAARNVLLLAALGVLAVSLASPAARGRRARSRAAGGSGAPELDRLA